MAWVRDGLWVFAIVLTFAGLFGFAEGLVISGVGWFTAAAFQAAPRIYPRFRRFLARCWRKLNAIFFVQVVSFAVIAERLADRLTELQASALFLLSLVLTITLIARLWKATPPVAP